MILIFPWCNWILFVLWTMILCDIMRHNIVIKCKIKISEEINWKKPRFSETSIIDEWSISYFWICRGKYQNKMCFIPFKFFHFANVNWNKLKQVPMGVTRQKFITRTFVIVPYYPILITLPQKIIRLSWVIADSGLKR